MRIDKYLWAVRLFKTRTLAADACKSGKILICDVQVKPSREIQVGETFMIKHPPVLFTYKVKAELNNRVGAKLVPDYMEDRTPPEIHEKLKLIALEKNVIRDRGTGRPTKRERRDLDDLMQ